MIVVVRAFGYRIEWDAEDLAYDLVRRVDGCLVAGFHVEDYGSKRAAKRAAFLRLVAESMKELS